MIFFGKKNEYIKFDDVISILEEERTQHHYASSASINARLAVESAIKSLKLHHIKNNPNKYMIWKKVFNNEAQHLLKLNDLKEGVGAMTPYIKRGDALNICRKYSQYCFDTCDAKGQAIAEKIEDEIIEVPITDVQEVRHGKWKINVSMNYNRERICPICKEKIESNHWNYCSNCGAKMDGEIKNNFKE